MSLANLNLVELDVQEVQEVEGGLSIYTPAVLVATATYAGVALLKSEALFTLGMFAGIRDGLREGLK